MYKRKKLDPLPPDLLEIKRIKKLQIIPKMNFLFIIKKGHSRWIEPGSFNAFDVQHLFTNEVITVKVADKGSPIISKFSEPNLRKYLELFFGKNNKDEITLESNQKDKEEANKKEKMSPAQLLDLRENLIYKLYEENYTAQEIAQTFDIKVKDVYNIYYKQEKKTNFLETNIIPNRFLVTQTMYDELERFMREKKLNPPTLNIIRNHLIEQFNLQEWTLSLPTISRMLKRLSFSRKRTKKYVERKNIITTIEKRKEVASKFISAIRSNAEIIFIDETGFNQTLVPLYGYAKIGEKCWIKTNLKTENYSVVAAITKTKVIGFQIFKGSINAEDFGAFIASLLNHNPDILKKRSKYIFFMDNAPIHRALSLKPFLSNFCVLYNAPYSPFLNPIEEFFGNWKFNFRKKFALNTIDILQKILRSVQEIDSSLLFSFYVHSMTFLKDCLDGKKIL